MADLIPLLSPLNGNPYGKTSSQVSALQKKLFDIEANVSTSDKAALRAKANEFEQFYIQQFIALTQPNMAENPVFGGGFAEEQYQDKMSEQVASAVQKRGGFGLSDKLYAQLVEAQERLKPITPTPH